MKKLGFSRDLEVLISKNEKEQLTVGEILEDLNYRSHGLMIILLSLPFVIPMPIMGLSTLFGVVMMVSAVSIITGVNPWIPKKWKNKTIPRETLENLIKRSDRLAVRLARFVKPRFLGFSKGSLWVRVHGVMMLIAAFILALPSPPGGNLLPGAATMVLAVGLVEEDGLILGLGYILTFINMLLVTLIVVYGLDWLMGLFS